MQSMVTAEQAGVAVTDGREVQVEHVAGGAEALVSGQAEPEHSVIAVPVTDPSTPAEHAADMAARLRDVVGGEADVEWAWAHGKLHVLQARPVASPAANAASPVQRSAEPVLETCSLYGPQPPAVVLPLDEVGDLIGHYRRKRRRLYEVADRHACGPGTALVLRYNALGVDGAGWAEVVGRLGDQVVVDVTPHQRQQIVAGKELAGYLRTLTADDPQRLRSVVVRAFIDGDAALVSEVTDAGVRLDYTLDGLLALNRGWATTREVQLDHDGYTADIALETCPVPCQNPLRVLTSGFVDRCQAARVYSLIKPLRTLRRWMGLLSEITAVGSCSGGCWSRL
ncbi:hypothetical protein [Saccharopolyspora hattusasensis]|uniref:hypothetical protein n=1 Tax=Saccharopolyspora hattusasensis TaxID=1128679 RepID=UPI003D989685